MRVLHVGKFFPPHRGGMEVVLADLIAADESLRAGTRAMLAPLADASDALLGAKAETVGMLGWLGAAALLLCGIRRDDRPPPR